MGDQPSLWRQDWIPVLFWDNIALVRTGPHFFVSPQLSSPWLSNFTSEREDEFAGLWDAGGTWSIRMAACGMTPTHNQYAFKHLHTDSIQFYPAVFLAVGRTMIRWRTMPIKSETIPACIPRLIHIEEQSGALHISLLLLDANGACVLNTTCSEVAGKVDVVNW